MTPPQNVPDRRYYREALWRREACTQIIRRHSKGQVGTAMVVLSCKRPEALVRLFESMRGETREWRLSESWFVDNGSGPEIERMARVSGLFGEYRIHPQNIGMGPAINDVLDRTRCEFILFVEDDLVLVDGQPFVGKCSCLFDDYPEIGIIKLKRKENWSTMYPYRRIGPVQRTQSGVTFHPWLPSPRWTFRWGQRPWYPTGIHNGWSLGPVMFRWSAWKEFGPLPSGQGRGQAVAAEEEYALRFNRVFLAARPMDFAPFEQPQTEESPGFRDAA